MFLCMSRHDASLHSCKLTISQMLDHTWIEIALLSLILVHGASTQTCSFDAAFTIIGDQVVPASRLNEFPDPEMSFFRGILRFTEGETQQVVEAAIQHYNTQFGLDFSNIQPTNANQRFLGNATFQSIMAPFNFTAITNRWLLTGNRRSRCFEVASGQLQVTFNDTTMLHGLYGGVDGRQVNAGDFLVYGYLAIFDACPQQPILIQTQTDIPARVLPVERTTVEEVRLYNRQLGRGRGQSNFRMRPSPNDPTMIVIENLRVLSFP